MNDFVGHILQSRFYVYCYILLSGTRVHAQNADTHILICGAALLV